MTTSIKIVCWYCRKISVIREVGWEHEGILDIKVEPHECRQMSAPKGQPDDVVVEPV